VADLGLDLSGVPIALRGVDAAAAARLARDWPAFVTPPPAAPFLTLEVTQVLDAAADDGRPYRPKAMHASFTAGGARFAMPEGAVDVDRDGRARVVIATADAGRAYFTLLNVLRASLAWRLPDRGGALVHAAGVVLEGRAFLLVGAEGAGKSTWAAIAAAAGVPVISDDVVAVDGAEAGLTALGGMFRSTHAAVLGPGRWPVGALLFPRHAPEPALEQEPPLVARAKLAANLPFVVEALEHDERIAAVLGRLATSVPCRTLAFARDERWIELLRRAR
jgi:hypothetical protein